MVKLETDESVYYKCKFHLPMPKNLKLKIPNRYYTEVQTQDRTLPWIKTAKAEAAARDTASN